MPTILARPLVAADPRKGRRFATTLVGVTLLLLAATAARAGETTMAETPDERPAVDDFTLPAVGSDAAFKLSEARGKWVALHFLLKTECPLCLRHTMTYAKRQHEVAGVTHVFIKPDSVAEIEKWLPDAKKDGPAVTIHRDADATLAGELKIPTGYKFHGETMHYPALVLIDPEGREALRYVGESNRDRFGFDDFAAKMKKLTDDLAMGHQNTNRGLALDGYDPVTYFTKDEPERGKKQITSTYLGATYHFTSEANRELFATDPGKYAPAYGGWCATAIAEGEKVSIDPTNYLVEDNRLFLFYKSLFANAKAPWKKNASTLRPKADQAWEKIVSAD